MRVQMKTLIPVLHVSEATNFTTETNAWCNVQLNFGITQGCVRPVSGIAKLVAVQIIISAFRVLGENICTKISVIVHVLHIHTNRD